MGEATRGRARRAAAFAFGAVIIVAALGLAAVGALAASASVHLAPGDPTACQSCHGSQTTGKIAGSPSDNRLCYSCHAGGRGSAFSRAFYDQGAHGPMWTAKSRTPVSRDGQGSSRRGLCVNCHDPHSSSPGRAMTWEGTALNSTALCVSCHRDTQAYGAFSGLRVFEESPHGNALTGVTRAKSGFAPGECLNCHDPHGQGYAKLLTGQRGSDFCLASGCHEVALPGSLWSGRMSYQAAAGVHATPPLTPKQGVRRTYPGRDALPGSCANCHNPHGALDPRSGRLTPGMTNAAGADLCFQCHTGLRFTFTGFSRHPIDQPGSDLSCTTCHNPHAVSKFRPVTDPDRPGEAMMANDEFCLRCHDGSYGFAANIRSQLSSGAHKDYALRGSCLSCHDPHGSSKQALLR